MVKKNSRKIIFRLFYINKCAKHAFFLPDIVIYHIIHLVVLNYLINEFKSNESLQGHNLSYSCNVRR